MHDLQFCWLCDKSGANALGLARTFDESPCTCERSMKGVVHRRASVSRGVGRRGHAPRSELIFHRDFLILGEGGCGSVQMG